jgi:hypothetical protein
MGREQARTRSKYLEIWGFSPRFGSPNVRLNSGTEVGNLSEIISIDYQLGEHGWSEFRLTVGDASVVVGPFGYCSDALGDLVRAALMIATSGFTVEVLFDGEPREWRLMAGAYYDTSRWTDFRLRVTDQGANIFEVPCSADAFVRAVLKAAQAIWDEYGADGYDDVWGGPQGFPLRALSALKTAVTISEPRTSWAFPSAKS